MCGAKLMVLRMKPDYPTVVIQPCNSGHETGIFNNHAWVWDCTVERDFTIMLNMPSDSVDL